MYEEITGQARQAVTELLERARLEPGDIFVVGCSSSEVGGHRIGSDSSPEVAQAILDGIYPILKEKGIYLAAQCCEHLNRAIVLEKEAARAYGLVPVNVVPQPKAGGSFATAAYKAFSHPVMVEHVKAAAGIDIGGTLIGMHLREVAVPTRLSIKQIGEANIICARTRPKFIGGQRAHYDESQM
ncbi:TIGR01440 family protein [Intestinimonas sp. MSJ-38]|nr:TIGR01440 family protein [Intestinimonas sp. MSJ-38]